MGSPVTLSGFNNIDFNVILNAIMEQERIPVLELQATRSNLEQQDSEYSVLATKLSELELASEQLASTDAFSSRAVTNSDETALTVSTGANTPLGAYDVVVNSLARGQVMLSTSSYTDSNTTVVADSGTLTIGGIVVTVGGSVTLQGLVDTINNTVDIPVTASVVQSAPGTYQLVLTGNDTGASNAYTVTNALTGGAGVTFSDFDFDGESGDSPEDNTVSASDADLTVNNISITSETNTVTGAIPGTTLTLLKEDPAETITLSVSKDDEAIKGLVDEFTTAYNDLIQFIDEQFAEARDGSESSIGRDGLLRGLRSALRSALTQEYPVGGTYSFLAEVGLGSDINGTLTFDATLFDDAFQTALGDLEKLFAGDAVTSGAFDDIDDLIEAYTEAGGLLPNAQDRLDDQIQRLDDRILRLEEQLELRRASLEAEFIAADLAIAQLNSQLSSLSALQGQFGSF